MKKLIIAALFIFVSPVLSADVPEVSSQDNFARLATVDNFVLSAVSPFYNKGLETVRSFGVIQSELKEKTQTAFGDVAYCYDIQFEGVLLKGLHIPTQNRFFITYLSITNPTYNMPKSLNVGSSLEAIEKALKYLGDINANTVKYHGESEQVVFHTIEDKVVRIELVIYTG